MGTRRTADDRRYVHFLTFNVFHNRRLLELDRPKQIVLGVLNQQLQQFQARCVGFVLMPEHVHALLWLPVPSDWVTFVSNWKRLSSFACREWYERQKIKYFEACDPGEHFWQPKYYSFEIYSAAKLEEKLNYMHANPVRRGLVQRANDYRWSSARWYAERKSVGVPIQWVECQ